MKENKVIGPSNATTWGHILLTPKSAGKWRLVTDFGITNDCSENPGWTIPNIPDMLQRIGAKKAKYFGIMDLTSGYHQAPLHPDSRKFTAFITFMGVFEYLRLPMGIKGASAYFQMIMATEVLQGLIHNICECYQDDICVFGSTKDEFLANLRTIFERLRKHKLTVNPKKCKFGLEEIEFVGHTINSEGITFSKEKREEVFNIEKPTLAKHLKSFIGCAEYFHSHVRNFSTTMRPLHQMVSDYDRNRQLVWTPEAELAWDTVRQQIRDCPTLYFIDQKAPIYLHTDASDYGIGGYLFQIINGEHRPVAFMSKSLTGAELRWSTIEKECYAIVYSLKKFEHLIRDTKFTLRTDHKNLTYINSESNAKVTRWKLLIQNYDFNIEYIKGELNFVADAFSRLVPFAGTEEELHLLEQFDIPSDKFTLIGKVHNSKVGHFGVEKTLTKLTQPDPNTGKARAVPWQYMREHVKRFIQRCPVCQLQSHANIKVQTANFTAAVHEPNERINVDHIGPLVADEHGNTYIIVLIDCFTRWVELYAVKDASALPAARALLAHFGRFGQPHQLVTDNGSSYANEIVKELVNLIGTQHVFTVPYSHEQNTIVERANSEVMRHLRALIFDEKTYAFWSDNIPFVQRIINTMTHESIGTSPAKLLLGHAASIDEKVFIPEEIRRREDIPLSDWVSSRLEQQKLLIDRARMTQEATDATNLLKRSEKRVALDNRTSIQEPENKRDSVPGKKKSSNIKVISDEFPIGSLVLVRYPDTSLGKGRAPHKLMMNLRGPYEVISKDKDLYRLKELGSEIISSFNVHLLRPYNHDSVNDNPYDVALQQKQMYDVEEILKHKGHIRLKSTLQFRVKWLNCDSSQNTWEPWKNLRNNIKLFEYLRKKNLHSLIPKQHRTADNQ